MKFLARMLAAEFSYDLSHTSLFIIRSTKEAQDSTMLSIKKEFGNTRAHANSDSNKNC